MLRFISPAGALVGSLISVGTSSFLGLRIRQPSNMGYALMHIGLGLMVSDNISADIIRSISSTVLTSLVLSAVLTFGNSLCVANLIKRIVWDFATCFLASAPAWLTAMTSIAIDYGMNPFPVTMLHLVRLIALKVYVPLLIFYLM